MPKKRTRVTKPRQAGSKSSLDKWQREVEGCLIALGPLSACRCPTCTTLRVRLTRLRASIQQAERR